MNEDTFNISNRKFLKMGGVGAQRESEQAVDAALKAGTISDNTSLPCRMTLEVEGIKLKVVYDGSIDLA